MGGGGDQTNPAQQTWQDYVQQQQQQQQYSQLGKTFQQGLQGAGSTIAGANSGLSGQVAQPPPTGAYGQPQQTGANYGASGPLFAQQGMGGSGGINQQQLAQILQLLGYG